MLSEIHNHWNYHLPPVNLIPAYPINPHRLLQFYDTSTAWSRLLVRVMHMIHIIQFPVHSLKHITMTRTILTQNVAVQNRVTVSLTPRTVRRISYSIAYSLSDAKVINFSCKCNAADCAIVCAQPKTVVQKNSN